MSREELQHIAERRRAARAARRCRITVCGGLGCESVAGAAVLERLRATVRDAGKAEEIEVHLTGCRGLCEAGPIVEVELGDAARRERRLYLRVDEAAAERIARAHAEDRPVEDLRSHHDDPFFTRQTPVVLAHAGEIDPEDIETCIAAGAYSALEKALTQMAPREVVEEIVRSGLRGRGGAGYPTGLKWSTVAKAEGSRKFVVCNGDEGDPGAFMDRSVLEGDPHEVLEGMAIAGYAVGADHGYLFVRAEHPLAIARLRTAIAQAERLHLLGNRILDTPFDFRVDLRIAGGAYVCGEETALIASIEGKRGSPRPRPPYPAASGLWGMPTLINNVETLANVPAIVAQGSAWFASIGTEHSKGTKVFALAGDVVNTGLVEVPMGMTLREIIYDVGGGIPGGRRFKAAQTGGPSGGCIPARHLDLPVDYESLQAVGTMMGSGGLIVMDESACMVDVARFFMDFCREQSCGKCVPCRAGTVQLHAILERITRGAGTRDDLQRMEELIELLRATSLCGLGQAAPNPVASTLRWFRDEYLAHVVDRRCPAGVCEMQPSAVEVPA
ncbi:NADH-ubiquinone oxidoreductase-F iron-sulfur binding region domain-containing protein [Anaeromyxobacter oryzae]|uniref:NADH dehydrogenase n=1 Tax=Anaeromyxobacter oryzae TaxID=2918170 RepID=A0ABN6MXW5_9BACT|nr:NADH-ubiquinone oxidoreductase-F iron-sulfur binding region domain-containing protein [Anaeromyxobacter oryzae]BDG05771.1 NADH dehydrogenase [Anaeromyxobacter oryzae]